MQAGIEIGFDWQPAAQTVKELLKCSKKKSTPGTIN
jgi:hypothetical protein